MGRWGGVGGSRRGRSINFLSPQTPPISPSSFHAQCPMPHALCPMPYGQCPMPYAQNLKSKI
ncbi:MAG: hypothetical protein RMY29_032590 [Nostoc sp. CreGUA01]|nr:hypothetical protein [Nostoc sp. CreGUA01]